MSTSPDPQPRLSDRLFDAIATRSNQALAAARHAPLEVTIGLVMALLGCWCVIEKHDRGIELYVRGIMMCYPALLGVFAISILSHFGKIGAASRWMLSGTVVAASAAFAYFRLDPGVYETEIWRWLTLCLGVTSGVALLPLILARDTARRTREFFWSFNARLLNHITLSVSFLGALCVGLLFAMAAARELLGVDFGARTFGCVAICILVGLTPWQVITLIPRLSLELPAQAEHVKRLGRIMCTYLFLPLMSIYLVILYLYQLRVVLAGMEAPKNMMSPLVLAAAGMLLAGMLLADQLEPAKGQPRGVFLKIADRLPMIFLPLMPMSAWAVWIRIEQYGWTEFRYLRLMLILALSVIFILSITQYVRKRAQPLMGIIATFGVLSIISTFGPLSAQAVSQRSQLERLRAHLDEDGLLDTAGHLVIEKEGAPDGPDSAMKRPISHESLRTIDYLADHFGPQAFESLIPAYKLAQLEERMGSHGLDQYDVLDVLALKRASAMSHPVVDLYVHYQNKDGVEHVPHAGTMHELRIFAPYNSEDIALWHQREEPTHLNIVLRENVLHMTVLGPRGESRAIEHDLSELLAHLVAHEEAHGDGEDLLRIAPERLRVYTWSEEGLAPITVSLSRVKLMRPSEHDPWRIDELGGIIMESDGPAPRD